MHKEFSIARWIWGAGISIVLAGVIGWFNVRQFEMLDAIPYLVVLGFIASISIWLNKYCESKDQGFRIAAFGAKVVLLLIMAVNAAYSFAAMREMSLARKADKQRAEAQKMVEQAQTEREKEHTKQIESVTTGAGPKARYEIAKKLEFDKVNTVQNGNLRVDAVITKTDPLETEQSAFKKYEQPLFWLMVIEAVVAGLTFVLMSGLKALRGQLAEGDHIHPIHYMTREEWEALSEAFPPVQPRQSEEQMDDEERKKWEEIARRRREYGQQLRDKQRHINGLEDQKANKRTSPVSGRLQAKNNQNQKTLVSSKIEGLKALREALKPISFYTPGQSFKVDVRHDEVWIRAMRSREGTQETTHSIKASLRILDDAVNMPHEKFQPMLEKFLAARGFKLESERMGNDG